VVEGTGGAESAKGRSESGDSEREEEGMAFEVLVGAEGEGGCGRGDEAV